MVMRNKAIRLGKALRYESAKRLPAIIILLILIGGWAFWQSYSKTAEGVRVAKDNTNSIRRLGEDNQRLLQQNKDLSEQNNRLAKENAKHIDCIAKLFATFIETGQVGSVDVDSCTIRAGSDSSSANSGGQSSTSPQIGSSSSSSPKSAPKKTPSQPDTSQGEEQQPAPPKLLDCKIDLLGLHIGC